jgi:hypothetical protein
MITKRKCSVVAALLLGLCVVTGAALADQTCRNVQSNVKGISDVFVGPDGICNGYEFCQYSDIKGTLNGRYWAYWNADGEEYVADIPDDDPDFGPSAFVLRANDIIETNHGNITAEERGIVNFFASEGYVAHLSVTGGTGKYENAVGWLSVTLVFMNEVGGLVTGEICGPNL